LTHSIHQARHGFDFRQASISTCDCAKKTQGVIPAMSCKALLWRVASRQKTPHAFLGQGKRISSWGRFLLFSNFEQITALPQRAEIALTPSKSTGTDIALCGNEFIIK
jgi:hypothetical protein